MVRLYPKFWCRSIVYSLIVGLLLGPRIGIAHSSSSLTYSNSTLNAEPPGAERQTVSVSTEGETTLDDSILSQISKQSAEHLEVWGLEPHQVRLSVKLIDDFELNYGIQVWIHANEIIIADSFDENQGIRFKICEGCMPNALPKHAEEALLLALERYKKLKDERDAGPPPLPPPTAEGESPPEEIFTAPPTEGKGLSKAGKAGVSLLAVGIPVYLLGGVFAGLREFSTSGGMIRDLRPAAFGLLIGATFPVVLGAVALTIDRTRHRDRSSSRRLTRRRRLRWDPVVRF